MTTVQQRALSVANSDSPPARILPPFMFAVTITAVIGWVVLFAMQQSAHDDLTGQIDALLPIARIGVLTTPIIIVVRAGVATLSAWLIAGALNDRIAMRTVAVGVLTWLPLLEIPALIDAISVLVRTDIPWAAAHIPIGLDAIISGDTPRTKLLTHTVNLTLLAFTALFARYLTSRVSGGLRVAIPTALGTAITLVIMPLFRV